MISDRDMLERLRELADATRSLEASPELEHRLLQSFADSTERPTVALRVSWIPATAFSFALLLATSALVLQTLRMPSRERAVSSSVVKSDLLEGFMPVPGASALPRLESASIVRYELPLTTLRAYGVEIIPEPNQSSIDADLLIGQDGYARAIRVIESVPSSR
jgi:hypothetical protein